MAEEKFSIQIEGKAAHITIDNPPVNAFGPNERASLLPRLQELAEDDRVFCLVFTGAGDRFFGAGTDLNTMPAMDKALGLERALKARRFFDTLASFPKPVIAAIGGICLGAGLELALACDFRIASEGSRFGMPEVNLGFIPGGGGTQRLARAVGLGWANYILFTAKSISAEQALTMGLVQELTAPSELLPRARRLAEIISAKAPLAIRASKAVASQGLELPLEKGLDLENQAFAELCGTRDMHEGVAAFLEKKKPNFQGR